MENIMQYTTNQLKEMVRSLVKTQLMNESNKEGFLANVLPGKQGEAAPYVSKVTKFLEDTFEKAEELRQEGEEMIASDVREHPLVGERNRLLLTLMGFLKTFNTVIMPQYLMLRKSL